MINTKMKRRIMIRIKTRKEERRRLEREKSSKLTTNRGNQRDEGWIQNHRRKKEEWKRERS